ncbi:flagellar hook-associated protein FlgL [Sulfurirhabdus autotrophica]|uniref:Flagellar hook-associated protein 3 FlgL n=1 Tax=Sulfurirhabdus autotrophica TaxID=1706046 RepID=A0A4R3YFL3_9PROT|nr:flagellar hook-associated protein FlgL [Sulfurirhabdus autotrophica]TCV90722.1 flagellar hook-associated protein 3 FlgL [Sulfurirhabdus autotrophica]
MRISSNMIYETGVKAMQDQQAALVKNQEQFSTGRRVLNPSDDPIASARGLEMQQSQSIIKQYDANANLVKGNLSLEDGFLGSITSLIQNVQDSAVQAGNPTIGSVGYEGLGVAVRARYNELLGLANQKDSSGEYIFSGYYQGSTPPFTQLSGAGVYVGDQGQRKIQISPSRQIDANDSGAAVFKPGVAGQDIFKTLDDLANALNSTATPASVATAVQTALAELSNELKNVSTVRASVGLRLNEIDNAQSINSDLTLQYTATLSSLLDVDPYKIISEMTQRQFNLEASQKTYVQVTSLSMFKLL